MVGFAKSLRLPGECSLGRNTLRLSALAITGAVHLLVVALYLWGGGRSHPLDAPRDALRVVLIAQSSTMPVKRRVEPARATDIPVADRRKASRQVPIPTPPTVRLQETITSLPDLDLQEITIPAAQASDLSQSEIATDYRQVLFERLAAQRHYPEAARLQHYQGEGAVMFRIDRSGRLLTASMEKSTGKRILDRAALTQVRRAAPFPEIPSELPDELIVSMSLQFLITQPGRQMAAR